MSAMIRDPYGGREVGRPEPLADAEKNGEAFLRFIGANNLEEARAMDAVFIRDRYAEYMRQYRPMFTVLDGQFCTGDPLAQYLSGDCVDVPMLAGNTADEFPNGLAAEDEASLQEAAGCLGTDAQRFLGFEESHVRGEAGFGTVNGIGLTVRGMFERKARQGMKNYYYRFDADIPGWDHPGTFHSVDLWFFFETLAKCWRPFVGRHYDLARQMCNYWANFIRCGDPNGADADGTPMPAWRPYAREAPCVMTFTGDGPRVTDERPTPFERFLIDRVVDRI
jgi:para-nitrobenzyl esterase